MYYKFNRNWENEELLKQYSLNSKIIVSSQLAIEDFFDHTNLFTNEIKQFYKDLSLYRQNASSLTEQQLVDSSNKILKNIDELFNLIGKENFIFYDDSSVAYNN